MVDAAYYRAWRAAHPEYRARQYRLRADRRRRNGREDRTQEYARRRERARRDLPERQADVPVPALHLGHELFEVAREVVGPRRTALMVLHDPLYDDLLSEATLALIEGRDPHEAVREYGTRERSFGRATCRLFEDAA
jgi:hypothetical protein